VNASSPAPAWTGQPIAGADARASAPRRAAPVLSVVRLDDQRAREARNFTRPVEAVGALPGSRDYEAGVIGALDRPGVALAFAAQLLIQDAHEGALAPPARAAGAYRTSTARTTGFMGPLDPIDVYA